MYHFLWSEKHTFSSRQNNVNTQQTQQQHDNTKTLTTRDYTILFDCCYCHKMIACFDCLLFLLFELIVVQHGRLFCLSASTCLSYLAFLSAIRFLAKSAKLLGPPDEEVAEEAVFELTEALSTATMLDGW